jgi:preprotein translocase subunit SecF
VGGVTTGEIVTNAFMSVLIASVLTLIYVWIRFTLFPGIAGVIALLHDVLIMTAFVSIFQIQVNSTYIAACLTIIGYSINDTIVIFDRIRENLRNRKKGEDLGALTPAADAICSTAWVKFIITPYFTTISFCVLIKLPAFIVRK